MEAQYIESGEETHGPGTGKQSPGAPAPQLHSQPLPSPPQGTFMEPEVPVFRLETIVLINPIHMLYFRM